jgi:hypothetical protein
MNSTQIRPKVYVKFTSTICSKNLPLRTVKRENIAMCGTGGCAEWATIFYIDFIMQYSDVLFLAIMRRAFATVSVKRLTAPQTLPTRAIAPNAHFWPVIIGVV